MDKRKLVKTTVAFFAPLTLFILFLVPYSWANQTFIVEWFGCGCPKVDELGNIVQPDFNANDFTALFWILIAVCSTVFSGFISKKLFPQRKWLRITYVIVIGMLSLWIAYAFFQMMMWK